VTDPTCLEELFALSGRRLADYVELMPVTPFYRLHWEDGTTFDYSNDAARLDAEIAKLSPADVDGYRRFLTYSEGVFREGYEKLGHVAFLDFKSMIAAAPQLMRYEAFRSVYAMVSRYIREPKLREAFSFHTLLVGGNPFRTSAIYALIHALEKKWGVWFPRGGTHALVRGLVRLFEDLGGRVMFDCPVTRIETAANRAAAIHAGGVREAFDAVASNGDIVHTYADLLDHARGAQGARALKRKCFSPSLFVIYFGVNKTFPDVPHHNIMFGPRYRDLLRDIYDNGKVADDFSLYLHHPTASDPALAPAGKSSFYVLSPVPHLGKFGGDWGKLAPIYADRILSYLDRQLMPGLVDHLAVKRWFTPADFQSVLNAHVGSAFSLEPVLWQSAFFRVHNRDDVIGNLYFVGAGTHPGAGIPGVVGSAKATARLMLEDLQ
jgi:phytoene desaturase